MNLSSGPNRLPDALNRFFAAIALIAVAVAAWSQNSALTAKQITDRIRPAGTVVVHKHATGADMVEITMLDPTYPPDLLKAQAQKIGENAGSASRGVALQYDGQPGKGFLRVSFATDHLADPATGTYRLQPIVRAFAGAPDKHRIEALVISFTDPHVTKSTLRTWTSKGAVVAGQYIASPPGLEYRVALLDQNPAQIDIPETFQATAKVVPPQPAPKPKRSLWLTVVIAVGSAAAGALVYFIVLSMGRPNRDSMRPNHP